jgi:hypothetical protein
MHAVQRQQQSHGERTQQQQKQLCDSAPMSSGCQLMAGMSGVARIQQLELQLQLPAATEPMRMAPVLCMA